MSSAEMYDPSSNTWSSAGILSTARDQHTATLLQSGKVLVTGGVGAGISSNGALNSAELYDPSSNTWSTVGSLITARYFHTATLLPSGKVLVAGGNNYGPLLSSAELYDPSSDTWSVAGNFTTGRDNHTATLLPNGNVLVAGGSGAGGYLSTAELYDSAGNSWSAAASLSTGRANHTATLLPNGKLFVAAGQGLLGNGYLSTAEVYDPASNTWSVAGSFRTTRAFHTATLLSSGKVLVAAGANGGALSSAEFYDSSNNMWSPAGSLITGRVSHTATLMPSGKVLIVGGEGFSGNGLLSSAEAYDPASNTWSPAGELSTAREYHTATLLANGKLLVAGGIFNGCALKSAELYDPTTNTWSAAASLIAARYEYTATLLANGKVLVAGGNTEDAFSTSEVYDPLSNTWSAAGNLNSGRIFHTATLLPSGKVLIAGGSGLSPLLGAEAYDPASSTWSAAGNLSTPRVDHTATLLPNGKVLVAGGGTGDAPDSAEVYDPSSNTWSAAGNLNFARGYHTATLLPSGNVLLAGGTGNSGAVSNAEVYDPASNTWNAAGTLITARYLHTATLLPNGMVLVAGGNGIAASASAELTDDGLQYQSAWRPIILTAASPVFLGNNLTLTGTKFKGISEASGGSTNNSATNYPVVQLRSLGNDQTIALPTAPASPWSDTAFTSLAVPSAFPTGYAAATVFTNGIPGVAALIQISALPISVAPGTLPNAQAGAYYGQTISASGGTGTFVFAVTTGSLPSGVTLNSAGLLSGTAAAGGVFNFTIIATDSDQNTGTQAYSLTVTPATIAVSPATLPSAQVGLAYNQSIIATGGTPAYSYAVTSGSLPLGLNLGNGGQLAGIPSEDGSFAFTITATDSSTGTGPFAGSQSYSVAVFAPTIGISPTTLSDAQVGASYDQQITASGGTPPYSFAIASGALPAGLYLGMGGEITGTPAAGGSFNMTITATDSSNGNGPFTSSMSYSLMVNPPSIAIGPTALPDAQAGVAYSQTVSATGGTPQYTFAVFSGELPAGMSLAADGQITGVPAVGGTFNITVTATDSSGGTGPFIGIKLYTLSVGAPPFASPATAMPPNGNVGDVIQFSASASDPAAVISWNFGDGSTGNGDAVSHIFVTTGNYLVTATATSGADTASSTVSVQISPLGTDKSLAKMKVTKLAIALQFADAMSANDTITIQGTLAITQDFVPLGQPLVINVGGVLREFDLDSTGKGNAGADTFILTLRQKEGVVTAQNARFSLHLVGNFKTPLGQIGFANTGNKRRALLPIEVDISLDGAFYKIVRTEKYKSVLNVSGTAN